VTARATFWLAAAALFVAAVALPVALVAAIRAGEGEAAPAAEHGGMQMGGEAMAEHMAPAPMEGVPDASASRGGQALEPKVQGRVWTFDLVATPIRWEILDGTRVTAWTYNGTVPGPELRVPYGQRLRIRVENELPEATTVHWHGIAVPNAMDGVPDVTQEPIEPGGRFTYEFRAIPAGRDSRGGTFLYHSHQDEDRQLGLGLAGALVIEPPKPERYDVERTVVIGEWNLDPASGETRPAMDMEGMLPNFFTLNGKSFPATETIRVRRGDRVLLRLIGAGQFMHPMHLHGMDFRVVAKDGHELASPFAADVIQIGSGERYDIAFTATEPGKWIFHCHIGHHMTNNGESPGGLILIVNVAA
jgi:FtsP/CotA-like multicopper oxidase with cupredoxin domain